MPTLYIVGTPIGNLEDITMRALRILSEVDFILCEDTRITKRLLDHYKIATPTISYHQHSDLKKTEQVLEHLERGRNLALVSDAGTPGISDPGGKLVAAVLDRFDDAVAVESVPGPSAVTAALSISGIPTDRFVFLGFPPHKKGRNKFLKKVIESEWPVVIYESKHRIIRLLEELGKANPAAAGSGADGNETEEISDYEPAAPRLAGSRSAGGLPVQRISRKTSRQGMDQAPFEEKTNRKRITSVVICRELSKMHETVYRGELDSIIKRIKENADDQKGEFVVIVGK